VSSVFKHLVHKLARLLAVDFYRLSNKPRPHIGGNPTVAGSFPPLDSYLQVGPKENYFIHGGYTARNDNEYCDDTSNDSQWQLEVYKFGREICDRDGLKTVCDVGCGSAYKLLEFFPDMETVGVDVPKTVEHLKAKWPQKNWVANFGSALPFKVDLVIASDVIEHLPDPDVLLNYIAAIDPKKILISTPDRNLLRLGTFNGPPRNTAHTREWSFMEFRAYIESFFEVEAHFISFSPQATQCILCQRKK
jgi:SAM-dependent methyltransferase